MLSQPAGEKFHFPSYDTDVNRRIELNLRKSFLLDLGIFNRPKKVRIILDLEAKPKIVEETTKALDSAGFSYTLFFASEVLKPTELLKRLETDEKEVTETNLAAVYLVRSSNGPGLGYEYFPSLLIRTNRSFVAANQKYPTVFCPCLDHNNAVHGLAALCQNLLSPTPVLLSLDLKNCVVAIAKVFDLAR